MLIKWDSFWINDEIIVGLRLPLVAQLPYNFFVKTEDASIRSFHYDKWEQCVMGVDQAP